MKITGQRKASIGILALTLGALAVDRGLLGAGGPAAAAAAGPAPDAVVAAAGHTPAGLAGPTLASRLEALAAEEELEQGAVGDLFAGEALVPWKLSAILGVGARGSVIIDDKQLRVGQVYDGAVLRGVHRKGAVFTRDGADFQVLLQAPTRSADR